MKPFNLYINEAPLADKEVLDIETVIQEWYPGTTNADKRTHIYESTACIVAVKGIPLTTPNLTSAMKDSEFDGVAKTFYERFLKEFGKDADARKVLLRWIELVGGPVTQLGKMQSFIQNSINNYYSDAPKTFEVLTAAKTNTADVVLIQNGSVKYFFALLKELSMVPESQQIRRVRTTQGGMCTILNTDKKGLISFYQVSLKKGVGEAQAGKAGSWLNKNFMQGVSLDKPKNVSKLAHNMGVVDEGLLDFLKDKITSAVDDVKNFARWSFATLTKISRALLPKIERFAQSILKRDKGIKAIENILSYVPVPLTEEYFDEKAGSGVKLNQSMIDDFKVVDQEFLKKKKINEVHKKNVKLYQTLNKRYTFKGRPMDPIVMLPNTTAGLIGTRPARQQIQRVLKMQPGDFVSREDLNLVFKLGSNFAANVAIYGILSGIQSDLLSKPKVYKTLSSAIFSLAANLESEVKFGNTALPLVIVYGGKKGKLQVLGKRVEYQEKRKDELTKTGKKLNDFPVLVLNIGKAGGKEKYNTVTVRIISQFIEENESIVPEFLGYSVRTNSGSNFTCTIEGGGTTTNWRGRH